MNGVGVVGNEEALRVARNFVQILVSATPYNLMTTKSRIISPENIVRWSDVMSNAEYNTKCDWVDEGDEYVGLDKFLGQSHEHGWSGAGAPIRTDTLFNTFYNEATAKNAGSKAPPPVALLAVDYMFSICRAHAANNASNWAAAYGHVGDRFKAAFDQRCKTFVKTSGSPYPYSNYPSTESDGIINDLMQKSSRVQPHFKVVRIVSGESGDDGEGECGIPLSGNCRSSHVFVGSVSGLVAKTEFLEPISRFLQNLKLFTFCVLGDFGEQDPQRMLQEPMYEQLWTKMQVRVRWCGACTRTH